MLQGGSMREAIKRSPYSLSWYQKGKVIAHDIAQGLAYLHKHKMVRMKLLQTNTDHCLGFP